MDKKLRKSFLILLCILISGCGTLRTIGDKPIAIEYEKYSGSQPCVEIVRIYSGIQYDYCVVFAGDGSD
ncbi:hypothetical protein A9Q99_15530 [Gammaproteobacteria bacterium 45_16_T64]|nr:hypothetical protein A9Q99_15530 [Gammaproteobacteria bacterium 45_16_T64]